MGDTSVSFALSQAYQTLMADDVGPFLGQRGFVPSGASFVRRRGLLYDVINFQADWHNGSRSWHGFFVNAGIGSAEVDEACRGYERAFHPLKGSLLQRRWEQLVPELPYEVQFDMRSDMQGFTVALCEGLDLLLNEMERIGSTTELVRYAVDNNLLIEFDKTCCYLASVDDIDTLTEYVSTLHRYFGGQDRWTLFSRDIGAAVGPWAELLRDRGILGPAA